MKKDIIPPVQFMLADFRTMDPEPIHWDPDIDYVIPVFMRTIPLVVNEFEYDLEQTEETATAFMYLTMDDAARLWGELNQILHPKA